MILNILLILALIGLIIGTYTDFKKREVPDWLSYSLIISGLGLRLLYSSITFEWLFFVYGLLGFGIFFGLAWLMFYSGQWGGGDSKVLMGIGALVGFEPSIFSFFVGFIVNLLLIGAVYGLVWSIVLAIRHQKEFLKEYKIQLNKLKKLKIFLLYILVFFLVFSFFIQDVVAKLLIVIFAVFFYSSFYVYVFVKSVENSSMYKIYKTSRLTEGDWIANVIKYKGKYICGPKDLGIAKKQINLLKKYKINKVLVKEGIPFIPSFLIAFIATYMVGNIFFLLL